VGGIVLVLGIQARWVALALAPILAGATWAHWGNGWMFGYTNGGWEYPFYLTLLAIVQFMLGDGAYALVPSKPIGSSETARTTRSP
jgi:putative oxidoreductase